MTTTFNGENIGTTSTSNIDFGTVTLDVFPNPAQNKITISSNEEMAVISIYNLAGQKVLEKYPNQSIAIINTMQFTNGMYFIKTTTKEEKIGLQKIVIKK